MTDHTKTAIEHFEKEFNCAQSVFIAFAREYGIGQEQALKLTSSFGGGMGRQGLVCGAVSAAYMVLGLEFGFIDPDLPDARSRIYDRVQAFTRDFTKKHGSIQCRELIGYDLGTPEGLAGAKASGVLTTKCKDFIRDAVCLVENIRTAG